MWSWKQARRKGTIKWNLVKKLPDANDIPVLLSLQADCASNTRKITTLGTSSVKVDHGTRRLAFLTPPRRPSFVSGPLPGPSAVHDSSGSCVARQGPIRHNSSWYTRFGTQLEVSIAALMSWETMLGNAGYEALSLRFRRCAYSAFTVRVLL